MSDMKTDINYFVRLRSSAGVLAIVLAIYNLLLIASRVFVNRIYINSMPQDLFGLLDGIYRVHLGQVAHRDFSSAIGLFNYALPASFMSLNFGLINSLDYSEATYVVAAFVIYLYLLLTRLDLTAGFFLGIWIPLALLARMNIGDSLEFVTEAMQYNRRCDVFLLLLLLLYIPARESDRKYLIIDGVLYGAMSALLFYSKITFGLVALGFAPIMLSRGRANIIVIAAASLTFLAVGVLVEIVYGVHFAWITDVKMAGASISRDQVGRVLHVLRDNAPELGLLLIPAFILLTLRKLTLSSAMCCLYIGAVSVLIVSYSAQSYVLTLPVAFVFIALDALKFESGFTEARTQIWTRYKLLSLLASAILIIESYPLAMNIGLSTYRAAHAAPLDSTNAILSKIVVDQSGDSDDKSLLSKIGKMPALDIFTSARVIRPKTYWDNLLMNEYSDYLHGGMTAALKGCADRSRISTIDAVNPFPMLLGWPTGGGTSFAAVGYAISKKAHLPDEIMFRDINCVMIPKAPVMSGSRDGLLDIYWPFLSRSFQQSFESDMWTVLNRRAQSSD
jgi:hypothetical protein